jgi:hypothetical protein
LASKKGIAITATIAAAIVGSSFLIWLIPQSSPGSMVELPRDDDEILSDVYSRHQSLATNIQSKFDQWKSGEVVTTSDMLSQISLDQIYKICGSSLIVPRQLKNGNKAMASTFRHLTAF